MKKTLYLLTLSVMFLSMMIVVSEAREADYGPGTLYEAVDLSRLSIRFAGDMESRSVEWVEMEDNIEISRGYAMLSYDLLPWLTVGAGGGRTRLTRGGFDDIDDDGSLWLLDAKVNLWRYDLYDPKFFECRLKIDAELSYWDQSVETDIDDVEWNEVRGSLTISAEFFVEGFGEDKRSYPYSTKLFAGPFFSNTGSSDIFPVSVSGIVMEGGFGKASQVGLMYGGNLFVSHNLCLGFEGRVFDDTDSQTAINVSLSYHF